MKLTDVCKELGARGYEAKVVSPDEALGYALDAVNDFRERARAAGKVASVGWGGSETVKELGIRAAVEELAKTAGDLEIRDHRTDCDLFLLSANALLADGRIVNIDGTGNRIAASIFGPKRVIYLVGSNKLVEGGVEEAIARIKSKACPPNARRLGRKTPCATVACPWFTIRRNCTSPDCMCKVMSVFDAPPTHTPTTVLLLDGSYGY